MATDGIVERTSMPNSTQPAMRGIEHVGITVPDLEAASRFFVEAFGAEILSITLRAMRRCKESILASCSACRRQPARSHHAFCG